MYQSIPLYFAHWEDSQLARSQLDEAFKVLVEKALLRGDRRRFSLLAMAFLAQLNNGHTRFYDPSFSRLPPPGMTLRLVENRWTVTASVIPGLKAGDVICEIQGRPIDLWYVALLPYTVGSRQSRTVQFGDWNGVFPPLLGIFLPDTYAVTYEDARGARCTLTVDRTALLREPATLSVEGRLVAKDLAYIRIPSFLSPEFEVTALSYVKDYSAAACLILDVRGNGGGNTPHALIRALMNCPYRWWLESRPVGVSTSSDETQRDPGADSCDDASLLRRLVTDDSGLESYQGRLIILVDRGTWSAAEDFVMPFKDNGRAVVVGEMTGGSSGQPQFYTFENGMVLGIGAQRVRLPDGTRFEGVGLVPDIAVDLHREHLYGGNDPVLDSAVAVIRGGYKDELIQV